MATFTNQATLTVNDETINSNIVTGEILETVAAAKAAALDAYVGTDIIPYSMSIINSGAAALTGLTVADNLGAYTTGTPPITVVPLDYVTDSVVLYVNGVLQATPTVTSENPLTITGINIPAGGNAVIIYGARANEFAPLGEAATITNTVTVSGGGIIDPVTATDTILADTAANLDITKSLNPLTVAPDGTLTYTFVISNSGATPVVTTDNAIISDLFDPIINITSVTFNGTAWTETTNYTYDTTTGQFTSVAGNITVPAATFTQDPITGVWTVTPGTSTLVVTGTV